MSSSLEKPSSSRNLDQVPLPRTAKRIEYRHRPSLGDQLRMRNITDGETSPEAHAKARATAEANLRNAWQTPDEELAKARAEARRSILNSKGAWRDPKSPTPDLTDYTNAPELSFGPLGDGEKFDIPRPARSRIRIPMPEDLGTPPERRELSNERLDRAETLAMLAKQREEAYEGFVARQRAKDLEEARQAEERRQILRELDTLNVRGRTLDAEDAGPEITLGEEDFDIDPSDLLEERPQERRAEIPKRIRPSSEAVLQARRAMYEAPYTEMRTGQPRPEFLQPLNKRMEQLPLNQETETLITNLRAEQVTAQEEARTLDRPIQALSATLNQVAENFKNSFGVELSAHQAGHRSVWNEINLGVRGWIANAKTFFGTKTDAPSDLIAKYNATQKEIADLVAKQQSYQNDAVRLQQKINTAIDPIAEEARKDKAAAEAVLRFTGVSGRPIASHEGTVLDAGRARNVASHDSWFHEGDESIRAVRAPQQGRRAERRRETEDRRIETLIKPLENIISSAADKTANLLHATSLEDLEQRLKLAERPLRDLRVATHPDRHPELNRPAITAVRDVIANIQKVCKDFSRQPPYAKALENAYSIARAFAGNNVELLESAANNPNVSAPEKQLLETTISALTSWKEAYRQHFASLTLDHFGAKAISFPRSDGRRATGHVSQVIGENVRVVWTDESTGQRLNKDIPIDVLGAYQFTQAVLQNRNSYEM